VLTIETIKTQLEAAETAADRRTLSSLELKRAKLTYDDLATRMKKHGFEETEASVASKLSRATVPAAFFLPALVAIGCEVVKLEDI
jgi:virulence-associated protein VapD